MKLFRVCPWDRTAERAEPGHPLYVPPTQGAGRVDNPHLYRVLYASDSPVGAIAERFGNLAIWNDAMLRPPRALPRSKLSLIEYEAERLQTVDLDEPRELLRLELRPSQVISRERALTQRWAERIYQEGRWDGVRWWSYYGSQWGSLGLWRSAELEIVSLAPLTRTHRALADAAAAIGRLWQ